MVKKINNNNNTYRFEAYILCVRTWWKKMLNNTTFVEDIRVYNHVYICMYIVFICIYRPCIKCGNYFFTAEKITHRRGITEGLRGRRVGEMDGRRHVRERSE